MLRVFLLTLLGLLCAGAGIYLGYNFLLSLRTTAQPLLLIASLILSVGGLTLLIKMSRLNESMILRTFDNDIPTELAPSPFVDKTESFIDRNNKIVSDWIRESDKRDKMKILEIAAAAQEDDDKNRKLSA